MPRSWRSTSPNSPNLCVICTAAIRTPFWSAFTAKTVIAWACVYFPAIFVVTTIRAFVKRLSHVEPPGFHSNVIV